jgi:hypothetical protein
MAAKKNLVYLNKDFTEFRNSLVNYARTYFPTTYNDFSPSSPGMMLIEMASYVGDVMSFYLDNQYQETFLQYARQANNVFDLAYMFGYKPKVTGVATADIDFYQRIPALGAGSGYAPDFSYTLLASANSNITSNGVSNISFLVEDPVDFSVSSSGDPTEITIYSTTAGNPSEYLLKKTRKAISATVNTTSFTFSTPQEFATVTITDNDIIGILDIVDSDGNEWYEVDYLGQEMVYKSIKNTNVNNPTYYTDGSNTPYLLQLELVQRRFVTRVLNETTLQLQFGSGTTSDTTEEIIPNPNNVGLGLPFEKNKLTAAYSPTNFIFNNTYGIAPYQTTLTVRYLTGGGIISNVPANTLTSFAGVLNFNNYNLAGGQTYYDSFAVNNPRAATGGQDGDTLEEIRQNSSANFASQLRNVTQDDYLVRSLAMPPKYGVVSKVYVEPTKLQNVGIGDIPSTLDMYILSSDNQNRLVTGSAALKQNLSTYLSQYRIIGDTINIKDAFIINIGIDFDIIVLPDYVNSEVLTNCISELQGYFAISEWQINEPIIMRDLYILLDKVAGVQTVKNITVSNKVGTSLGYSQYAYDVPGSTINGVVYPSLDPMIFEVKYPQSDIRGRVVPL